MQQKQRQLCKRVFFSLCRNARLWRNNRMFSPLMHFKANQAKEKKSSLGSAEKKVSQSIYHSFTRPEIKFWEGFLGTEKTFAPKCQSET